MGPRSEEPGRGPRGDARPDGEPSAQALGQRHDVGHHSLTLVREPGAGAPDAGLHLVEDEEGTRGVRDLPGSAQVALGRHDDAPLALDGLQNDRRRRAVDRGAQRLDVAERDDGHVARQRPEGILLRRLGRERQGSHRAAVEAARGDDHPRSTCEARQLERRFVRLRA